MLQLGVVRAVAQLDHRLNIVGTVVKVFEVIELALNRLHVLAYGVGVLQIIPESGRAHFGFEFFGVAL